MKLHPEQRMLVQIYRRAAGLGEPDYRRLLRDCAGVNSTSSACELLSNEAFARVMSALETRLFSRVQQGAVSNPLGRIRWIRPEFFWRRRIPSPGLINSVQCNKIKFLWEQLQPYLEAGQRTIPYLAGIIHQATGREDLGMSALTSAQAWNVIEALKDRMSCAIRADPIEKGMPF